MDAEFNDNEVTRLSLQIASASPDSQGWRLTGLT